MFLRYDDTHKNISCYIYVTLYSYRENIGSKSSCNYHLLLPCNKIKRIYISYRAGAIAHTLMR